MPKHWLFVIVTIIVMYFLVYIVQMYKADHVQEHVTHQTFEEIESWRKDR